MKEKTAHAASLHGWDIISCDETCQIVALHRLECEDRNTSADTGVPLFPLRRSILFVVLGPAIFMGHEKTPLNLC
jgi:hypothetical protein